MEATPPSTYFLLILSWARTLKWWSQQFVVRVRAVYLLFLQLRGQFREPCTAMLDFLFVLFSLVAYGWITMIAAGSSAFWTTLLRQFGPKVPVPAAWPKHVNYSLVIFVATRAELQELAGLIRPDAENAE